MGTIHQSKRSFAENVKKQQCRENRKIAGLLIWLAIVLVVLAGIAIYIVINRQDDRNGIIDEEISVNAEVVSNYRVTIDFDSIPGYEGEPYCEINNNVPCFDLSEVDVNQEFEQYCNLDSLGRCGTAFANLSEKLMPTEEREAIGMVRPSGWHTVKYPDIIEDLYLYNRCHLIANSLAGENANELNLITGTRYMNIAGMLPFESFVRKYIEKTGNHVLYRVTPIFNGNELVARGVMIEAQSVEDSGSGICFNVFTYNVQPGIIIDYSDGSSRVQE